MTAARALGALTAGAAMLVAASTSVRADPPLAGSRLVALAPAQVFCSSPGELAAYTAALIRHDPVDSYRGCTAVLRGTPVQVLQDLGPYGHWFHVVRAVATQGFPFRPVDAYTYSVGLGSPPFDTTVKPYYSFPFF